MSTASPSSTRLVERNVEALLARQRREQEKVGPQHRIAAAVTRFMGSLPFIYLHLLIVGAWVVINSGVTPLRQFDPTFVLLATIASVEAIFLTAFVLMTQNRMQADADRRADLDLQISLLTEHEITQMAKLLTAVAERVGVEQVATPELHELQQDVKPEHVLDTLEQKQREYGAP
ncbi:MAG TPA: DUF1003 domain-containing protein [Steroidobacteraceae bacterium]|nr:DUF1003 domain-containing protein [Steroidobacteraceae bacterium]